MRRTLRQRRPPARACWGSGLTTDLRLLLRQSPPPNHFPAWPAMPCPSPILMWNKRDVPAAAEAYSEDPATSTWDPAARTLVRAAAYPAGVAVTVVSINPPM